MSGRTDMDFFEIRALPEKIRPDTAEIRSQFQINKNSYLQVINK